MPIVMQRQQVSFAEFYPAYLSEHSTRACRELHFAGSTFALFCLAALAFTGNLWWLPAAFACSYSFAWVGHVAFEKNQPATFRHPLYSLVSGWVMYWQMLTGQVSF